MRFKRIFVEFAKAQSRCCLEPTQCDRRFAENNIRTAAANTGGDGENELTLVRQQNTTPIHALTPGDVARIGVSDDKQCELIRNTDLRPDVKCKAAM